MDNNLPVLSASKLSNLDKCSWIAYAIYVLKVPDTANFGSKRGSTLHDLLECLLNKRHHKKVKKLIKDKTINELPCIVRYLTQKMKKIGLGLEDDKGNNNLNLLEEMLLVALNTDFFLKGLKLEKAELKFQYTNPEKTYTIKGFIDKLASDKDTFIVIDYKTSSPTSEDYDDLSFNVQALMYSLYCRLEYQKPAKVRFLMLRSPDNVVREVEFTLDQLLGFEQYLISISNYLKDFTYAKGVSNLAANKPYAKKGFSGPIVCGKASYKGQLKKDGTEMYYCKFKFPQTYYGLYNEEAELIKTALKREELELVAKPNELIMTLQYNGCPRFNSKETTDL